MSPRLQTDEVDEWSCAGRGASRWPLLDGCLLCTHSAQASQPSGTASSAMPRPRAVQASMVQQCASCHGDKLGGCARPPLAQSRWIHQPLAGAAALDLVNKIQNTMPADRPGSLTPQQSADLVAHILKTGGFPAALELAVDEAALSSNRLAEGARDSRCARPHSAACSRRSAIWRS